MKLRKIFLISLIGLMAAGCNLFSSNSAGGIIKTANGGSDWQFANKVGDVENALGLASISQIIYDPNKAERVLAGTFDNGMFLSEDGGNSWRQILSRFIVYDLVVDPNSSDVIYVAGAYANHGRVLATRDGGKSWVEIFNEASTENPVRAIAMNPDNNQELVIGLGSGTLIKSTDAGVNWKLLQRYTDRINRIRWQQGNLFVVVRNTGLLKSTNGGGSFVNISSGLSVPSNLDANSQGYLLSPAGVANFNQVSVSRSNTDTIYLTTSSGLFQTFNGGLTWDFAPLPAHQRDVQAVAVTIAPSSDNVAYASVGSVIYKTSDAGQTWQAEDTQTTNLIVSIAVHPELPQQALAGIYAQ